MHTSQEYSCILQGPAWLGGQGIGVHRGSLLFFVIFTLVALCCSSGDQHLLLPELYMQHRERIPLYRATGLPLARLPLSAALCLRSAKGSS